MGKVVTRKMTELHKNKYIKPSIKICVSVLLTGYLILKTDLKLIWENIRDYPMILLLAALILMLGNSAVGAMSLHALYKKESASRIFVITLESCFYSLVLPGQLLGESTKILLLSPDKGKLSQRVLAVFIDKVLNCIVLLWLGTLGLFCSAGLYGRKMRMLFLIVSLGVTVIFMAGMSNCFCLTFKKIIEKIRIEKIQMVVDKYFFMWTEYSKDKKALFCSAAFGIVYHLIINLIYCVLAAGLSIKLSFWNFCWVNALLTFILLLPVSIGGLGMREASMVGLLGMFGVADDVAFSFSILIFCVQMIRAIIGGMLIMTGKGR